MAKELLKKRIEKGFFLLDGAMGTQLMQSGIKPGSSLILANIEDSQIVVKFTNPISMPAAMPLLRIPSLLISTPSKDTTLPIKSLRLIPPPQDLPERLPAMTNTFLEI